MTYEKLKVHAAKLGYSHLSLEFCMEMRPVAEEFAQFMEGMRQLVGPPDTEPFSHSDGCADSIEPKNEGIELFFDGAYAPGELVIDENHPEKVDDYPFTVTHNGKYIDGFADMYQAQKWVDEHTRDR